MNGRVRRAKLLRRIYKWMLDSYGPQGWWPLLDCKGVNTTKTGSVRGYHPCDYSCPGTSGQRFEVCIGAVLTQNTAWVNVEKALTNLKRLRALTPRKLLGLGDTKLKQAIRPAGYYNQKAGYLVEFSRFYLSLRGKPPQRDLVLACRGIGNETADSILLYAYAQPEFVVDAYTRRIFSHFGMVDPTDSYLDIKEMFQDALPSDVPMYQEFHALVVEHAKRWYSRKPYGSRDPLRTLVSRTIPIQKHNSFGPVRVPCG